MLIGVLKDRPITGNDPIAYDCMVPIDGLLKKITPCFQRSPQKYVAICGPVQSGKSTVLNLVKQSLESQASPTKVIVVDLSYCREHESLEELLDRIKSAFQVVVDDILNQTEGSADNTYLNFNIDLWKSEQSVLSVINQLMSILPSELKLLLALENVDLKEESGIWDLLSELRKIHDKRNLNPLKRFSVLTT
jgi:type II secretory pathway predicted ATPase ExeA